MEFLKKEIVNQASERIKAQYQHATSNSALDADTLLSLYRPTVSDTGTVTFKRGEKSFSTFEEIQADATGESSSTASRVLFEKPKQPHSAEVITARSTAQPFSSRKSQQYGLVEKQPGVWEAVS